ncbi:putative 60S ribosomal protein L28e [Wickerhamiella sorbophila]|uniref:Putative 60S ribosomal protein L28e n=1 Tax=Wickerhamiella sorbophila TaxID=45607 RepID=A0A2T0FJG7_9ASCO|nr:putative 60S ribosomal protein L28e [Wickerhamiella sorbophila]PRT55126.1 putative 60S ribosomal protein L28e [Wickerhamiella sorbophila]
MSNNVSYDLIWQISRANSSYIVKRKNCGGVQFSREPLNVTGFYTQAASGFANKTAVGVVSSPKGIKLITKSAKNSKSAKVSSSTFKHSKDSRKIAAAVSKSTVNHRDDLLEAAVAKASALARGRSAKKVYASKRR